ncbi:MAG: EAL domain-containing protein [Rhodocyclaceae bacterium]|nr:EAL domain-containing protein [Rhodocyclaceae bacterium]
MSLIKQLWLAILVVTLAAFSGSLVISTLSARAYLESELNLKNHDNATVLALAMTQLPKDATTVELLLAAQFDNAHYDFIRLTDPSGQTVIAERLRDPRAAGQSDAPRVPDWFKRLIPIDSASGQGFVSDGWNAFGTLTLRSHTDFAYASLWSGSLRLLLWFAIGAGLIGALGTLLLRVMLRPLDEVVDQARAIGERRFITTEAPSTPEFATVVKAMNTLSERVRGMLAEESARLEHLRRAIQHDAVSGLLNREHFLARVDATLESDTAPAGGALAMVRLTHLIALNEELGRATTDELLRKLADGLNALEQGEGWTIGRLNGTDFALLAPDASDPQRLAQALAERLDLAVGNSLPEGRRNLPVGIACYQRGDPLPQLLAHGDVALTRSESMEGNPPQIEQVNPTARPATDLAGWRGLISEALALGRFSLAQFPVLGRDGELLHVEAPVRMRHPRQEMIMTAGDVLPWATRCGLLPLIDEAVIRHAFALLELQPAPVCINLSAESMCHADTVSRLAAQLKRYPEAARRLWIDLPEHAAFRHSTEFRALCREIKPLGCKVGLEHVGQQICHIGELHDVGLDYLKISASMVRNIHRNPGNQTFLRGLATIGHTMGLLVIAEGVGNEEEYAQLVALGFDGLTGPGVRHGTD